MRNRLLLGNMDRGPGPAARSLRRAGDTCRGADLRAFARFCRAPEHSWVPTVNVATQRSAGPSAASPCPPKGMAVNAFVTGLDHPRTLYVLPNGDVLVAETNAPPKPDDTRGIKGWITRW